MRVKISLIGAGNIGGTLAHLFCLKGVSEVVLFDINEGVAKGKALDIAQSGCIERYDTKITGTSKYEDIKDSDVIVITAGIPRKPGMSRDDLISTNSKVIKSVAEGVKKYSKNAFVIVITNPLDAMVYHFWKESGLNEKKVVGMAGVLDTSRYKHFISQEIGVSASDISAFVLGGHGDDMVPLVNYTTVSGIPLKEFIKLNLITQEKIDQIILRTRNGGGEIVSLLGNGSAYYSPAESAVEMAFSYLNNKRKILPCACKLNGEYGVKDIYMGVPCIIGQNGVETVIEVPLSQSENEMLKKSIESVQELISKL